MAYDSLKQAIQSVIRTNGNREITGALLQQSLLAMINSLGANYDFKGKVESTDYLPTEDYPSCYILVTAGTYVNMDDYVVGEGQVAVVYGDGTGNWEGVNFNVLTGEEVTKLQDLPTDAELTSLLGNKVDKVTGKGLSTNDYTDADKAIVDGVDATYAKKDGYYSQMGVGVADNLAGKGDGVPAEFTRRTTGGDASVADGVATLKAIKGKTIVWNQLVYLLPTGTDTSGGITYLRNSDGSQILNGVCTGRRASSIYTRWANLKLIVGHKYAKIQSSSRIQVIYTNTSAGTGFLFEQSCIFTATSTSPYFILTGIEGQTYNNERCWVNFHDLTAMFGAGNEPSTVEEFEALFPNDYYPYNAGQLLSFNGTDIVTDGFNQFDGTKARVFGGKAYYINGTYTTLKFAESLDGEQADITPSSHLFTPSNDGYIFATGTSADFCINLSHSGYRNGQYEPYWKETKSLPSLSAFDVAYTGADGEQHTEGGLKSAGNAYDEQTIVAVAGGLKVKNTRRIGVLDLGNLAWVLSSTPSADGGNAFVAALPSGFVLGERFSIPNIITASKYKVSQSVSVGYVHDGCITIQADSRSLTIADNTYSTANSLKTDLAGILMYCELKTPVETDGEAYNPNYRDSDFGTETILPEGVDEAGVPMTAPFNGSIVYGLNAVDTLRNMPKDYISKDSMDAILAAFVSAGIIAGYTLTFDATAGKYTCAITPNTNE